MSKTDRSRSIPVNGQKIIAARRKRELDQQAFSDDAKISLRSLQRAEKGGPISKKILNSIAAELNFNPEELIVVDESYEESMSKDGFGFLLLKPIMNYKDIAKLLEPWNVYTLDIEYLINPSDELIEPIADVIAAFEHFCLPLEKREKKELSQSEMFKRRMSLNNKIKMIESEFSIFANNYSRKRLIWDFEQWEGQELYYWKETSEEFLVLRFFDNVAKDKSSITVKVRYGLSNEAIYRWGGDTRREIVFLLDIIESEDVINPNIEPLPRDQRVQEEIPF